MAMNNDYEAEKLHRLVLRKVCGIIMDWIW